MPSRCIVKGCNTNYLKNIRENGLKKTFRFPKNAALREKWLEAMPSLVTVSKHSVVCINHFTDTQIKKYKLENGVRVPLQKARLEPDAIPTIFDCVNVKRRSKTSRAASPNNSFDQFNILHFCDIELQYMKKLKIGNWKFSVINSNSVFYTINQNEKGILSISTSITIKPNLLCSVIFNTVKQSTSEIEYLNKDSKINFWSQLQNILDTFGEKIGENDYINLCLKSCSSLLIDVQNYVFNHNIEFNFLHNIQVIGDQLKLILSKKRTYSNNAILNAFFIYQYSSSVYEIIREKNILILPHTKTLQKLSAFQNINSEHEMQNINYLTKISNSLSDTEKIINIQIDEMYLKKQVNYKSKSIIGFADDNSGEIARTVLGFLINSVYGHMKEIVALIPVHNLSGEQLNKYTINIINKLQTIGFKVLCVASDNHKINRKSYDMLSARNYFVNPDFPNDTIFLCFDTVHIFKNIFNNWINKHDTDKTFVFPSLENNKVSLACFKDLRDLHKKEMTSLIKKAYRLNKTTHYPSNMDKQNVKFAINVFHESTIAALISENNTEFEGTIEFLNIFNRWWSIVSNTSLFKGKHLRNIWLNPIYSKNDPQVEFLMKFQTWLTDWKILNHKEGCLTDATYNAIFQTNSVLLEIIKNSFEKYNVDFFLPGKIQTSYLEYRWGEYRRLSGTSYYVSYQDIIQSEKKIRIRRIIKNFSDDLERGTNYSHLADLIRTETTKYDMVIETSYLVKYANIIDQSVNAYICGYAAYTIAKTLK